MVASGLRQFLSHELQKLSFQGLLRAKLFNSSQFISAKIIKQNDFQLFLHTIHINSFQFLSIHLNKIHQTTLFLHTIYLNSSQFISIHLNKKTIKHIDVQWLMHTIHINLSQFISTMSINNHWKINGFWWMLLWWVEINLYELYAKTIEHQCCLINFAEMNLDELKNFAITNHWNDKFCNSWLQNSIKPFATMFDKQQHLRRHQCKIALQHCLRNSSKTLQFDDQIKTNFNHKKFTLHLNPSRQPRFRCKVNFLWLNLVLILFSNCRVLLLFRTKCLSAILCWCLHKCCGFH